MKTRWLFAAVMAVVCAGLIQADNASAAPTQARQGGGVCTASATQTRTRSQLKTCTTTATKTRARLKDGSCTTK
jgi:hypothetical protein